MSVFSKVIEDVRAGTPAAAISAFQSMSGCDRIEAENQVAAVVKIYPVEKKAKIEASRKVRKVKP